LHAAMVPICRQSTRQRRATADAHHGYTSCSPPGQNAARLLGTRCLSCGLGRLPKMGQQ
jgi:hypothetical protein